jgi:hypothetical protein
VTFSSSCVEKQNWADSSSCAEVMTHHEYKIGKLVILLDCARMLKFLEAGKNGNCNFEKMWQEITRALYKRKCLITNCVHVTKWFWVIT